MPLIFPPDIYANAGFDTRTHKMGVGPVAGTTKAYNFVNGANAIDDLTFSRASTGTRFNASGVLESVTSGQPRFDYNPATLALAGLLMEEQRQNIVPYSVPNPANWSDNSAQVAYTTGQAASPDGGTDGTLLVDSTGNTGHYGLYASLWNVTSGTTYTQSVFAKAKDQYVLQLVLNSTGFGLNAYANFNLSNGTVPSKGSAATASIQPMGNGWYRCSITAPATASQSSMNGAMLALVNNWNNATRFVQYIGTGTDLYVWGVQCETGAFVSSYIPTTGSAATRAADLLYTPSIPWFNTTQGSYILEGMSKGFDAVNTSYPLNFSNNSTTNMMSSFFDAAGAKATANITPGGSTTTGGTSVTANTVFKHGLVYASGTNLASYNGDTLTGSSFDPASIPTGINTLTFGRRIDNTRTWNGWLTSFKYWNTALTSSQLQQATT